MSVLDLDNEGVFAKYPEFQEALEKFFNIEQKKAVKIFKPIPEPELFKCPKSDKCIMVCEHRGLHEHQGKYCKGDNDNPAECPSCVEELKADVTFFAEDFEIE